MGNKLCAPWKKGFRDEAHPWAPKKDSHLLRLWAEIFEVQEDEGDISWARVSDDVVPVNITCIQDAPETVFQITAYNRHVEKVFDVRLIQPGTGITQASECFVHWKDSRSEHEWGLNFTTPVDARRFRDCCMCKKPASTCSMPKPTILRKASFASVRESIRKRVRGRKATSNPTSPISQPRRAVSTPDDLALQDCVDGAFIGGSLNDRSPSSADALSDRSGLSSIEALATLPRGRNRQIPNAQALFSEQNSCQRGSDTSVYDNVNSLKRQSAMVDHRPPPHPNMYRPIGEREIPFSEYQQGSFNTYTPRIRSAVEETHTMCYGQEQQSPPEELARQQERRWSKTEVRQLSREPTVLKICQGPEGKPRQTEDPDYDNLNTNMDTNDLDQVQRGGRQEEEYEDRNILSPPRKSHSSSSPEWPPPPDSIGTATPETPGLVSAFDSSTLKRMLQSLPGASPTPTEKDQVFDYNENVRQGSVQRQSSSANSSPVHATYRQNGSCVRDTSDLTHRDLMRVGDGYNTASRPPLKPQRMSVELPDSSLERGSRGSRNRDSYPDSGVSVMTNDTTCSLRSGDSGRSGRSATLPPGLGLGMASGRGSSTASSAGSSSGRHSDLIHHHTGSGSETTEVRHLTTSDLSESESEEASSETGTSDSSIHTMPSESQASFASRSAAVRKAGVLTVKNWLIHKKRKLELAPKRNWKKYWVCLKGTVLLFYDCEESGGIKEDSIPRHMLVIEGGVAQAVPEHPKRENIFALSTAFGDAYLFEAPSQIELENWTNGIHSACASSYARQHGKENTIKLLRSEIHKLENGIDLDIKMKKMASLQLSVVTDPKSKQAIEKQIAQWDENLEKLYIEQYRLRCYMASLQGSEPPNPKTILGYVSKGTKAALSRVGVFTVTSFHALVCARSPLTTANLYNKNKKRGLLSTFKADSVTKIRPRSPKPYSPSSGASTFKETSEHFVDLARHNEEDCVQMDNLSFGDNLVRIGLPNNQSIVVGVSEKMTVQEVLESACSKRQLNPTDHFMRLKVQGVQTYKIPEKSSLFQSEEYDTIEICPKSLFQIELQRQERDKDFGFQVEAELAEDTEQEDELCVFISDVVKGGVAARKGLVAGDEILVFNSKVVAELDMVYVENLLQDCTSICLTVRSCRVDRPVSTTALMEHADIYIENMVCPPPPVVSRISDKAIGELIVPAPNWVQAERGDSGSSAEVSPRVSRDISEMSSEQIDNLLQGAEQVTHFCRLLHSPLPESMNNEEPPPSKPLSDSQRIRKVIMELIETERAYVKDLNCLIERYLEPMKEETFLSSEDVEQLFGNILEIVQFQRLFLQSLEESVELEANFNLITEPKKFRDEDLRRVLFSLGGSFLYYANHFKLYSSFCASHSKAQRLLNPDNNLPLKEFLRARNPKQQHSATLESYLIKPIQRILKYPLLLRQLKDLTDPQTDEHHHLSEALRGMEAVAEHINEMQKIYEEYGCVFEELIRQYKENPICGNSLDLNVGELQMYGTVNWLNILDELGKIKKGVELLTLVFVFKAGIVILTQERNRNKRKLPPKPAGNKPNTGPENTDQTRFQAAIPVDQLQVRTTVSDTERHGLWELVHCRSEKEGRPERIFQFASSHEAKREFLRTIHATIRESVRRMSIPSSKSQTKNKLLHHHHPHQQHQQQQQQQQNSASQAYIPYSNKRPDTLVTNPLMMRSVGKKKGRQIKADMVRHSMDLDDRVPGVNNSSFDEGVTGSSAGGGMGGSDFRTRSQTLTDLNKMDLSDDGQGNNSQSNGSQSTIGSDSRNSSSAKLVQSSANPGNYNSNQNIHQDTLGSPIWKPRSAKKSALSRTPSNAEDNRPPHGTPGHSTSPYIDQSNPPVVYDDKQASVILTPPNVMYFEHEDTEC